MKNLYLLLGEEKYDKEVFLQKIKDEFGKLEKGINFINLDKDTIENLESEILTYPFGYDKKLIVVRLPESKASSKEEKESANKKENVGEEKKSPKGIDFLDKDLEKVLSGDLENVLIIFVANKLLKSNKLYNIIEKHGEVKVFDKQKPLELTKWICDVCKDEGVIIQGSDANYFVTSCGNDKQNLFNEINKAIDYVGKGNKITREIIDAVCNKTSEVIIFNLTDYIGSRNTKRALETLEDLLSNKEPLQVIIIMIARQFKQILLTKIALAEKKNVVMELGIQSYPATKLASQARNYTMDELVNIYLSISNLDVDCKVGKADLKIGLQKIICSS